METIHTPSNDIINVAFENDETYKPLNYDLVEQTGNTYCPEVGLLVSTDSQWVCEHATILVMDEDEFDDFENMRIGIEKDTGEIVDIDPYYSEHGFSDAYDYAYSIYGMGTENIISYPVFEETPHPRCDVLDDVAMYELGVWIFLGD